MDQLISFVEEKWVILLIILVVLIVITTVVKTVVKWILALAIIAGVLIYGFNYTPESLKTIGTDISEKIINDVKGQALKYLTDDAKDAKFEANKDGSFTISSPHLKLEGKANDKEVKVTILGQTFTMDADTAVKSFIEQAKKNAK
ncbi:hypothetical protein E0485_15895 [Paenibacillus albiflavus]|uniref:Uncharacterized protein n=1 Tax=Paenibacillus albiflavus TaxID=2545760 RepID=A0A4R4E7X4_9BACL|nr:hypothetical protein [Paenibacillus albiflavus]TCZ75856.1 hypothetical protein E0485_15895 [Paenibacillus albiflavus]